VLQKEFKLFFQLHWNLNLDVMKKDRLFLDRFNLDGVVTLGFEELRVLRKVVGFNSWNYVSSTDKTILRDEVLDCFKLTEIIQN
jgi:hypothetical protein